MEKAFEKWWLSEGIKQMPKGNEPPEHASIARLAWEAATQRAASLCMEGNTFEFMETQIRKTFADRILA